MCENYLSFKGWIIFHCVYATLYLSIHLLKDVLCCFHLLAIVNNVAMNMGYRYLFQSLRSNILGVHPGAESRDHTFSMFFRSHHTVFHSGCIILLYSFIWQSNAAYGSTLFCLSIYLLMDIQIFSTLGYCEQCYYE